MECFLEIFLLELRFLPFVSKQNSVDSDGNKEAYVPLLISLSLVFKV